MAQMRCTPVVRQPEPVLRCATPVSMSAPIAVSALAGATILLFTSINLIKKPVSTIASMVQASIDQFPRRQGDVPKIRNQVPSAAQNPGGHTPIATLRSRSHMHRPEPVVSLQTLIARQTQRYPRLCRSCMPAVSPGATLICRWVTRFTLRRTD